jgi:type IV pilus assembly protein PilC
MAIDIRNIPGANRPQLGKKGKMTPIFSFLNRDIYLFGKKLNDKSKERFYTDLNILLSSGLDIKSAFEIIVTEQKKSKDKLLFQEILNRIVLGDSLSESVRKSGMFSEYEYFSMKIGEEGSLLDEVFTELAQYFSRKIKQKRILVSAFTYPILVFITAIVAVIFMMNFVVPMFEDVFLRFNGQLPGLTILIIKLSKSISSNIGYFILLFFVLIISLYSQRKKKWYRRLTSNMLIKLPVIGKLIRLFYVTRFCHAMALLTGSKTPITKAIELNRRMIGFYPMEQALEIIENDIFKGMSLNESMRQFNVFDSRMISLIKISEEVNQLDVIFNKLNVQYNEELEHQLGVISSLIEPLMILFVGILVGLILVAMYLPIFKLSTSIY